MIDFISGFEGGARVGIAISIIAMGGVWAWMMLTTFAIIAYTKYRRWGKTREQIANMKASVKKRDEWLAETFRPYWVWLGAVGYAVVAGLLLAVLLAAKIYLILRVASQPDISIQNDYISMLILCSCVFFYVAGKLGDFSFGLLMLVTGIMVVGIFAIPSPIEAKIGVVIAITMSVLISVVLMAIVTFDDFDKIFERVAQSILQRFGIDPKRKSNASVQPESVPHDAA